MIGISSYDLIRYIIQTFFGLPAKQSVNTRGIDMRPVGSNVSAWGFHCQNRERDEMELRGRIGEFFTSLKWYLFSTCELHTLCYISGRYLTY